MLCSKNSKAILLQVAMLLFCSTIGYAQSQPAYRVLNTFPIGGAGGWDYIAVDPSLHRLYVSHSTEVNILDEATGDSVGVISHTPGVHGIALVTSLGKGYISNGRGNTVQVFSLQDNKPLTVINTGKDPDAIMYDEYSKKIFVCDGHSNDATIIDPATDKVVKTIPLGGKPETAVSDDKGKIYVNIESKSEIAVVDAASFTVIHHWPAGKGEAPTGLAMDRRNKRLFIGCDNKLMIVMDANNGKVIAQLPIGEGCDGTAFDPVRKYAFSANGEGTLTVIREISPDKFSVAATVPTKKGARTLAFDTQSGHLFLPTAERESESASATGHSSRPRVVPGTFQVLEVGQ